MSAPTPATKELLEQAQDAIDVAIDVEGRVGRGATYETVRTAALVSIAASLLVIAREQAT